MFISFILFFTLLTRKFGYVDFASEEDLQKAMELNGKKFMGQELKLDRARSKESLQDCKKERDLRTLFVKNLAFSVTVDDLKEVFKDAIDVRIPPGQNNSNRGFAFIEFKTTEDAKEEQENLNNPSIRLEYSQNSGNRAEGGRGNGPTKTFVKGLWEDTTDQSLNNAFEGAVGAKIVTDRDTSKGYGFVDFDNGSKAAKEAMKDGESDRNRFTLHYTKTKGEGGFCGGRRGGR